MQSKDEITKQVVELLDQLHKLNPDNSGSLMLTVDADDQITSASLKGNVNILHVAFDNWMKNNQEFNRTMMSMFGAYLNDHPEEKDSFMRGLDFINVGPSVN